MVIKNYVPADLRTGDPVEGWLIEYNDETQISHVVSPGFPDGEDVDLMTLEQHLNSHNYLLGEVIEI